MSKKILFIPGLFVTPRSQKYAAMKDAMPDAVWDIVDYSPLYAGSFQYQKFLDVTRETIANYNPDQIVTYSFGAQLYQSLVAQQSVAEAAKTVFIVPIGDYANAPHGQAILNGTTKPEDIYMPIRELKVAHHVDPVFFADLAQAGQQTKHQRFLNETYVIAGSLDRDTDSSMVDSFQEANRAGHVLLQDDHRMSRNMPLVCALTQSFLRY